MAIKAIKNRIGDVSRLLDRVETLVDNGDYHAAANLIDSNPDVMADVRKSILESIREQKKS